MQFSSLVTLAFAASSYALTTPRQLEPIEYAPCGGFVIDPQTCEEGYQCIQPDPRRPDVTDLPGICVKNEPITCAGAAGDECYSTNFLSQCYDWPLDGCDPENGDKDCIGICLDPLVAPTK
ncbi:hypothetical protein PFICI_10419 [Pestalotiopsis fici W106-1]|uniref:Uncharacterized protein n=1 Tax=Pestalotiopsis fici (strain W106-1 / CGMCC3.15140) TaxID=1229662 RepID=W3WZ19_PESFW|nr:uncharacterized protein PFICI_10419 [Pestalotiopsis fici W106-1]ETS78357.1 hypothetical protein PFICI_10419 [Pestalotiopsis fici W106-1]